MVCTYLYLDNSLKISSQQHFLFILQEARIMLKFQDMQSNADINIEIDNILGELLDGCVQNKEYKGIFFICIFT